MILVVDDETDLRNVLSRSLVHHGYRVETAGDGAEAYELLRSPDCKCILLDINMPRINGVELLLLMQAEDIHIPTIVMAGFDDYGEEEMKQFSNVATLLHKPFQLDDALKAIKKYALPPSKS
ncbi:MAG: response regulator [Kiritimatiellae bacterium]|nr:response regulator [Kiritimatiellia bacterium]